MHVAKTALGDPSPTTIGSNVSVGAHQPRRLACVPRRPNSDGAEQLYGDINLHFRHHLTERPAKPLKQPCKLRAGHSALLHACTVEDGSLIGMGATLCDGSKVSDGTCRLLVCSLCLNVFDDCCRGAMQQQPKAIGASCTQVEAGAIVAAGALVTPGTVVPSGVDSFSILQGHATHLCPG